MPVAPTLNYVETRAAPPRPCAVPLPAAPMPAPPMPAAAAVMRQPPAPPEPGAKQAHAPQPRTPTASVLSTQLRGTAAAQICVGPPETPPPAGQPEA